MTTDEQAKRTSSSTTDRPADCAELTVSGHRPLYLIARDIRADWPKPYFGAVPYIRNLGALTDITDPLGYDDARDVVIRFLVNASTWRGPVARAVKAELKALQKLPK